MTIKKDYDVIIYGASSFTSKFVIEQFENLDYKIALSSRNIEKIHKNTTFDKIPCEIEEIEKITKKTKILINLSGPYIDIGEKIIKACINTNTHYIDITGEVSFLLNSYQKFNETAKFNKVKIIQGCGFDSVPADLGSYLLSLNYDKVNIESTIYINKIKLNYGTWKSLLLGLRKYLTVKNKIKNKEKNKNLFSNFYKYNTFFKSYDIKFFSSDNFIVKRSSDYFKKNDISNFTYKSFINCGGYFNCVLAFLFFFFILNLVKFDFFYFLFLKYPAFFSFGVFNKNKKFDLEKTFFKMIFFSEGTRNGKIVKKKLIIEGPDPAYISTSIFLTEAVRTLYNEEENIENGVMTPSIAFYKTRFIENLKNRNIRFKFEI